jgi:hypothetical protein
MSEDDFELGSVAHIRGDRRPGNGSAIRCLLPLIARADERASRGAFPQVRTWRRHGSFCSSSRDRFAPFGSVA